MGELTTAEAISLWQLVVTAGIGLLQCALIWVGLRQMRTASTSRDRQLDYQHAENMRALEALIDGMNVVIERTGGKGGTA